MIKSLLVISTILAANVAYADEVVIHRSVEAPPSDSKTVVHKTGPDGCSSTTVHKTDGMGDSKTVHKSDC